MRLLRSRMGILALTMSLLLGLMFVIVIISQSFVWVGVLGVVISAAPIAIYYESSSE